MSNQHDSQTKFDRLTTSRFVIVGGAAALLFFMLFNICHTHMQMEPYIATIVAYSISFGFAYTCHKYWTYRTNAPVIKTLPRYFALQVVCLALSAGGVQVLHDLLGVEGVIISGLATLTAAGISYVVSTLWVFMDVGPKTK